MLTWQWSLAEQGSEVREIEGWGKDFLIIWSSPLSKSKTFNTKQLE